MKKTVFLAMLLGVGIALLWAWAQERFPSRPVNLVIPFEAGGSADIEARVFARLLEAKIGQPVVPVNRPGGGGAVGYAFLRTSPADGYTVAWASPALLTNYRMGTMPFSHRELTPIAMVSVQAMAWVIRTDAPWRTLEDLARFAQSNPGRVRVATAGVGSGTDMAAIAVANALRIQIVRVPLGSGARVPALLRGDVEVASLPIPEAIEHVKAGQLRVLVVTTRERDPAVPEAPTLRDLGFNLSLELFRGLVGPRGISAERIQILAEAVRRAAGDPEWRHFGERNSFIPRYMGPQAFAAYLDQQDFVIRSALGAGR